MGRYSGTREDTVLVSRAAASGVACRAGRRSSRAVAWRHGWHLQLRCACWPPCHRESGGRLPSGLSRAVVVCTRAVGRGVTGAGPGAAQGSQRVRAPLAIPRRERGRRWAGRGLSAAAQLWSLETLLGGAGHRLLQTAPCTQRGRQRRGIWPSHAAPPAQLSDPLSPCVDLFAAGRWPSPSMRPRAHRMADLITKPAYCLALKCLFI